MECPVELEPQTNRSRFTRQAGEEPILGYRLLEPLGVGGFGEVWKCLAPGGLLKAIKIVTLPPLLDNAAVTPAEHERAALDRVKEIRHPFLISVDRFDATGDELYTVMELADSSLQDEFDRNRNEGRSGIPESLLLHYLFEAAEVLDVLNFQHDLQHLDVKPANLLVINRHVKLADFGLVSSIGNGSLDEDRTFACGVTPRYASPEMMQGSLSRFSDQYSLAVVYQELLTGQVPYEGNGLLKRLLNPPNLTDVPEAAHPILARALASKPQDRYPSCIDFIQALLAAKTDSPATAHSRYASAFNRLGIDLPVGQAALERGILADRNGSGEAGDTPTLADQAQPNSLSRLASRNWPDSSTIDTRPYATKKIGKPRVGGRRSTGQPSNHSGEGVYPPIIYIAELEGTPAPADLAPPTLDEFISQLIAAGTDGVPLAATGSLPHRREWPGQIIEHSFPVPAVDRVRLKHKFDMILKECRADPVIKADKFLTFVVERAVPFWKFFSSKQRILKTTVTIEAPDLGSADLAKATVRIEPLDPEGPMLDASLIDVRSVLLRNIRSVLQAGPERRQHERWPCDFGVKLYPILPDWQFEPVIDARASDLSAQGVGLITTMQPETNRVYLRPETPDLLSDYAILTEIVRTKALPDGSWALGALLGRL